MEWVKVYSKQWLFGSGRLMTPEKRGVWIDLLTLAGEAKLRDGTLRHDINKPMTRDYIASILLIDRELLDACIVAFQSDRNVDDGNGRIEIWEDGTIEITNWHKYQDKPDHIIERETVKKQAHAIRRSEEQRTRQLTNKHPDISTDVLEHDFGYKVNKNKKEVS